MKIEETVIVSVSLLGMAETGQGTATFEVEIPGDMMKGAEAMQNALFHALGSAMKDVFPAFQNYTRTKYSDPEVD